MDREEKGSMVFDNGVAIPHGIQKANDRMLLAVGTFEGEALETRALKRKIERTGISYSISPEFRWQ